MTDDTHHLARQIGRIRDQIAAIGAARPTPEQLDAEDDADRIMAQRIHHARPGIPLHHVAAVLQVLRAVQEMDPPAPAVSEAEAAVARVRALHREEYGCCGECTGSHAVLFPCPTIRALDIPEPARD